MPVWINPWGLAAFVLGGLALYLAPLVGVRSLTVTLSALGVGLVVLGVPFTWRKKKSKNWRWLALGGAMSGGVLLLALFAPGLLNLYWAMDFPIVQPDPNKLMVVDRNAAQGEGRPLATEDWVDASTEAVRQNDAILCLQGVRVGPLKDRGSASYLQVHFRLANSGYARKIKIEPFDNDKHRPVLSDDSGQSYPFLDQRRRNLAAGVLDFKPPSQEAAEVGAPRFLDYLLVFELPPGGGKALKLQLPASAWGREGVCRFRISDCFEAQLPQVKKN